MKFSYITSIFHYNYISVFGLNFLQQHEPTNELKKGIKDAVNNMES
jgi:hypothetical protein